MTGDTEVLTESEDLLYQLDTLASHEPDDLDNPEFEVAYEDNDGREGFLTVCCIDLSNRAAKRIRELEAQLAEHGGPLLRPASQSMT